MFFFGDYESLHRVREASRLALSQQPEGRQWLHKPLRTDFRAGESQALDGHTGTIDAAGHSHGSRYYKSDRLRPGRSSKRLGGPALHRNRSIRHYLRLCSRSFQLRRQPDGSYAQYLPGPESASSRSFGRERHQDVAALPDSDQDGAFELFSNFSSIQTCSSIATPLTRPCGLQRQCTGPGLLPLQLRG